MTEIKMIIAKLNTIRPVNICQNRQIIQSCHLKGNFVNSVFNIFLITIKKLLLDIRSDPLEKLSFYHKL